MITCPSCKSEEIYWSFVCATYPSGYDPNVFLSCLPCDSAIEYFCESCGWRYTDGLSSDNPRSAENEKVRPKWLEGHSLFSALNNATAVPGVKSIWDD